MRSQRAISVAFIAKFSFVARTIQADNQHKGAFERDGVAAILKNLGRGCGCGGRTAREGVAASGYPEPTLSDLLATVAALRSHRQPAMIHRHPAARQR